MTTNQYALTIKQFCKQYGISQSMFYKLRKQGKAPLTLLVGRKRIITPDAVKDWQSAMEDKA